MKMIAPPPPAMVSVGGVTGVRLLVRSTASATPPINGQTTTAGTHGSVFPLETGAGNGSSSENDAVLSCHGSVAPTSSPAVVVSQTLASGEVNETGLANIKEKTPMCLVNELARYNKISHQYKLVDETGPAHKKIFSVVLKLGEEEYAATGPSIKKAQHAAAESSLRDTKYKHPISRNRNRSQVFPPEPPTPTVELNALAMKRGDTVVYTSLEHSVPPAMAFGGLHPPPPPHHHHPLQHPVLGPGLSSNPAGNNSHYLASSHHPHIRHDFPHHRYPIPPPPPPPLNRNFGTAPHPRGGSCAVVAPPFHPHPHHHHHPPYDFRGVYNQRFHPPPPPHHHFPPPPRQSKLFSVSVKVGSREFFGQGTTRQLARHQAATKALACLKNLGAESKDVSPQETHHTAAAEDHASAEGNAAEKTSSSTAAVVASGSWNANSTSAAAPASDSDSFIDPVLRSMQELAVDEDEGRPKETVGAVHDLKSEISLVHEITLKRRLNVQFHVINESGPPHMRVYVTQCVVSGPALPPGAWHGAHPPMSNDPSASDNQLLLKTEADGNGKKVSKKKAAEAMVKLLRELAAGQQDDTLEVEAVSRRRLGLKKKRQNLIKVQKGNTDYGQGINPISRLIQIQQAKREKEPTFALLTERGLPRRREFVMQVTVNDSQCTGTGPNKKLAKRAAAEVMLQMMGYSKPSPQPDKPAIRTPGTTPTAESANKKVTFTLSEAAAERGMIDGAGQLYRKSRRGGSATLQQLPGVIFMPEGSPGMSSVFNIPPDSGVNSGSVNKTKQDSGGKSLRLLIPERDQSSQSAPNLASDHIHQVPPPGEALGASSNGQFVDMNASSSGANPSAGVSIPNATRLSSTSPTNNGPVILSQVVNGQTSNPLDPQKSDNLQTHPATSMPQPRLFSQIRPVSSISIMPGVSVHQQQQQQQHLSTQVLSTPVVSITSGHASPGSITIMSRSSAGAGQPMSGAVRPKQQLIYLAEVLGFHVNFTDFPKKGLGQEYLSLVSLSTNPPQVSHGSGSTLEASQDAASLHALKCLAEMGLESVSGSPSLSNPRGLVSVPITTASGTGVSSLHLQPSSNTFMNGGVFPAAAPPSGIASSNHPPLPNRSNDELQGQPAHHVQLTHPQVQDVTMSVQATTQQRMQHHLHAS